MSLSPYQRPKQTTFTYHFMGQEYPAPDVFTLLRVDEVRIKEELATIPSDIGYWGAVLAAASRRVEALELDYDYWYAQQEKAVRASLDLAGTKVTEKAVESEMKRLPDYKAKKAEIADANLERDNVRAICDALRGKSTVLTTIAGLNRAEMEAYRRSEASSASSD